MSDLGNLFDKDTVENISSFVESKMYLLNQLPTFKEKDKTLSDITENFENSLSKDLKNKFDDVMRFHYQIDSYYFTLAYYIGLQHGKQIF